MLPRLADIPEWFHGTTLHQQLVATEHEKNERQRARLGAERATLRAELERGLPARDRAITAARTKLEAATAAQRAAAAEFNRLSAERTAFTASLDARISRLERELVDSSSPEITEALVELRAQSDRERHTPTASERVVTDKVRNDGSPVVLFFSNRDDLLARLDALAEAVPKVEALRLEVGIDVTARIAAIRAAIPPVRSVAEIRAAGEKGTPTIAAPEPAFPQPQRQRRQSWVGALSDPDAASPGA